ncbi:hypothetical protein HK101_001231 [Irineochytrium annulatum]|nr:hypothetical protein HK101_001231 [Irineochytrium annulatum]
MTGPPTSILGETGSQAALLTEEKFEQHELVQITNAESNLGERFDAKGKSTLELKDKIYSMVHGPHNTRGLDSRGEKTWSKPSRIIVDDKYRLAEFKLSIPKLVKAYRRSLVLAFHHIKPVYNDEDVMKVVRLRGLNLPLVHNKKWMPGNDFVKVRVGYTDYRNKVTEDFTKYPNAHKDVREWYVTFCDQKLFVFCHTDRFASEEITCVEHPCLGSLRECLEDLAEHGILSDRRKAAGTNFFAEQPIIFTEDVIKKDNLKEKTTYFDHDFYIPKDKHSDTFRHSELAPLSRDQSQRPTPFLLMDVPLVCNVAAGKYYDKGFKMNPNAVADLAKDGLTHHPRDKRPKNNLVCMSAPDQLFNPLRARVGPYTIYQIRFIYRTAYTAFSGIVRKMEERCIIDNGVEHAKNLFIALHTGFWGCGSFGGNKKLMAYLQIVAAAAAGIDRLEFHVEGEEAHDRRQKKLGDKFDDEVEIVKEVRGWYDDLIQRASQDAAQASHKVVVLEDMFKDLEEKELEWSEAQ